MSSPTNASPRTSKEPMAFTEGEFWFGALVAWILVFLLLPVCLMISLSLGEVLPQGTYVSFAGSGLPSLCTAAIGLTAIGAVVSIPVFAVFVLPAWAINKALSRVRSHAALLAVNTLFGVAVGAAGAVAGFASFGAFLLAPSYSR
ncbi:hypothetical protein [Microbacterium capsulatum]|uniref:Uncharacterized protein n=1 Tax=Microbacterium capsulatum TaxID=3041921 RepID=A0ABU0XCA8_9MICO|nr:hypothetical protein [Microbacterium sp. ASV81]MDQ4212713.1 hypothetical protein [Microbacterium sp. ASV81]